MEDDGSLIIKALAITFALMCTYHAIEIKLRRRANKAHKPSTPASHPRRMFTSKPR